MDGAKFGNVSSKIKAQSYAGLQDQTLKMLPELGRDFCAWSGITYAFHLPMVHNTFLKQEWKIFLHARVKGCYEFLLVAVGVGEMQVVWHLRSASEERGFASDLK